MITPRRIELTAAVACAALGVVAALYALFGPTIRVSTESAIAGDPAQGLDAVPPDSVAITNQHRSMFEDGVEPGAAVALGVMAALCLLVVLLATMHGRSPATRRSTPIWAAAVALVFFTFVTGFSVGLFFLPAALAAILAALAASRYQPRSTVSSPADS